MAGNSPSGSAPERVNSSVWQTPLALISTSTSPACGPSSSTSSMTRGLPASYATAARVLMRASCHKPSHRKQLSCGGGHGPAEQGSDQGAAWPNEALRAAQRHVQLGTAGGRHGSATTLLGIGGQHLWRTGWIGERKR